MSDYHASRTPNDKKTFKAPKATFDRNALYYPHDHGGDFVYEPLEPFQKIDVIRPGHFNAYREDLRKGTRITCRLGEIADGITEVELQVIERSQSERQGDIMVSIKGRDGRFTPCRHDGQLADDKKERVAA